MKYILIFRLLPFVLILAACKGTAIPISTSEVLSQRISVAGGTYTDLSVAELQTMLTNKDFTFINVHIPFEGNIAKTDLSIPYDQIDHNLAKLPSNKNEKVVLYCRSGRMSSIVAKYLVSQGYTNIWNLSGGMVAWEQAGLPMER